MSAAEGRGQSAKGGTGYTLVSPSSNSGAWSFQLLSLRLRIV